MQNIYWFYPCEFIYLILVHVIAGKCPDSSCVQCFDILAIDNKKKISSYILIVSNAITNVNKLCFYHFCRGEDRPLGDRPRSQTRPSGMCTRQTRTGTWTGTVKKEQPLKLPKNRTTRSCNIYTNDINLKLTVFFFKFENWWKLWQLRYVNYNLCSFVWMLN